MTGKYLKPFLFVFSFILLCSSVHAQVPQWAFNIGSGSNVDGYALALAPNGNVYLGGTFSGTIDLDPSASTYNVSSNGPADVFLACYTSSGSFLWGFNIGGTAYDGITSITSDGLNNVIIAGYFSGQNVDFDPSSNTSYLSDQGVAYSGGSTIGGDGFVAKYSATGGFQWTIDLGGSTFFDLAQSVASDALNNIYVGGDFHDTMDIDPSVGVHLLDALSGTAYLIKYTPAGQLMWGFNFGGSGVPGPDNSVSRIVNVGSSLYLAGCFHATSDFDPSANTASYTASGIYDGYLAKYDTGGNYKFVVTMSGNAEDQAKNVALDSAGDVYVGGYSYSPTITFNAGVILADPSGGNNQDIFLAKYDSTGHYQWAKTIGGRHDDVLYGMAISHNNLYYTGYFHDTVDFDPSPATAYLISNGQGDIYLCKNDLDGNYICAFGVGGTGADRPRQVATDTEGYVYMCGVLASTNTDVDPTSGSYILSAIGVGDAMLVKYDWRTSPAAANGYLTGDTICAGNTAAITFIATNGTAPYTIVYTNGTAADTLSNVQTAARINIFPDSTSTYRLLSIQGTGLCVPLGYPDTAAIVLVHPKPLGYAGKDTLLCPGTQYTLQANGGNSYLWYPSLDLSNSNIPDPTVTANNSINYHVAIASVYGCMDTVSVLVGIRPVLFSVQAAPYICQGDSTQVLASGGDSYIWMPDSLISNDTIANPVIRPLVNTDYKVYIKEYACGRSDTLSVNMIVRALPDVTISSVYDIDCGHKSGQIRASGAESYVWSPVNGLDNPKSATPNVTITSATQYTVTGTDTYGCSNTDSAVVAVYNDGTGRLFAPNAFTPNGDGKNDCFNIKAPGTLSDFELMVYDRWGNRIFLSYNASECWDGMYNGVPQPVGTYFYQYAALSGECGYIKGKGDVVLIR